MPFVPSISRFHFAQICTHNTHGSRVVVFNNFLTDEEVADLIRGGEIAGFERSTDQGAVNEVGEMEKIVSKTRTSSNAWCMRSCERLPGVRSATKKIEDVTGIPYVNYESFQLLNYEKNQFYRSHHDSSSTDTTPAGHRVLTFFLYLSDVEEGGETYFNKLDLAVKPKKGKALVVSSFVVLLRMVVLLNDDKHNTKICSETH